MNYELCKKLKDANFPNIRFTIQTTTGSSKVTLIEHPSLSELIEACGNRFSALHRYYSGDYTAYEGLLMGEPEGLSGKGSTPEEAVANLWLELKESNLQE